MFKYIVKRVILGIVTIWAVATLTFFLMNMVPGGPFLYVTEIFYLYERCLAR